MSTNINKEYVVIEPLLSGHRFRYLRMAVCAFVGKSCNVTLITDEENRNDLRLKSLQDETGIRIVYFGFKFVKSPGLNINLTLHKDFVESFGKVSVSQQYDHVFVPYLDYLTVGVALFGSPFGRVKFSGVLMRTDFLFGLNQSSRLMSVLRGLFFQLLIRNKYLVRVLLIDEFVFDKCKSVQKIRLINDPAFLPGLDDKKACSDLAAVNDTARYLKILVYGSLSERKGILELLEALKLAEKSDRFLIILAGKMEPSLYAKVKKLAGEVAIGDVKIEFLNFYIDDAQEAMLFSDADLVWVAYKNFYNMSGVLCQAGLVKKPVIATNPGTIGKLVEKYELGINVDLYNKISIIEALRLCGNKSVRDTFGYNGYLKFSGHTVDKAIEVIANAV